eukprot:scaffold16046_cov90-Isochrysis_galbana.AAC.1
MGGRDLRGADGSEPRSPLEPVTAASAAAQGMSAAGCGVATALPSKRKLGIAKLVQGIRQRLQPVARRQQTADYDTAVPKQPVHPQREVQPRDDGATCGRQWSDVPAGFTGADSRAPTARTASAGQYPKSTGHTGSDVPDPEDQVWNWSQTAAARRDWAEVVAPMRQTDAEKSEAKAATRAEAAAAANAAAKAATMAEAAKAAQAAKAAEAGKAVEPAKAAQAAKAAEAGKA